MAGQNYSRGVPMGNNQIPHFLSPPAVKAIARHTSENNAASSVLTLTENTTAIEIAANNGNAIMRWVPTSDTTASVIGVAGATANYDHVIPAGQVRRFVVPIEVSNNGVQIGATITSYVGANIENGLYRRVAVKGGGLVVTGSVLTTEYGSANSY
jgi:hypothetical protein